MNINELMIQAINFHKSGYIKKAKEIYEQIIDIDHKNAHAVHYLGLCNMASGNLDKAIDLMQYSINLSSCRIPEFYSNLGMAYKESSQISLALENFQKAALLMPDKAEPHFNMGALYHRNGDLDLAVEKYEKALSLKKNYYEVHINLANISQKQGFIDKAIYHNNEALKMNPDSYEAQSNLLYALNYKHDLSPYELFKSHERWGDKYSHLINNKQFNNIKDPDRKLNIGYVSPDFKTHSVAFFFQNIISNHDQNNYKIYCYADVLISDPITEYIKEKSNVWKKICDLTDQELIDEIKKDKIDILIDLAGHSSKNRLLAFAQKTAPIQITYLGYPNTSGLKAIDYRISDKWADPNYLNDLCIEKIIRIPTGFLSYNPPEKSPVIEILPAINNSYVTFGSCNNLPKINDKVIDIWSKILINVKKSRLILKTKAFNSKKVQDRFLKKFNDKGISKQRIDLVAFKDTIYNHLTFYNKIDIALDTFPYNGTTTTCEALWMGVPVVCLKGDRHASRVSLSILSSLGLDDLAADSYDTYISMANDLANNLSKLSLIRKKLRNHLINSSLCDGKSFTQALEYLYRKVWKKFCEKLP